MLIAVAVDCEFEIGGCSFVKQLKVEEGDGEACGTVATDFLKLLFVSSGTLFSKCGNVRRAVTMGDVSTQKSINSLPINRFDKSAPGA